MLSWFEKNAPIRTKFNVLIGTHTALAGASGIAAIYTAGLADNTTLLAATALSTVSAFAVSVLSKRLICNPYVNTVVRMEGLAAGDVSSPINYTDYTDCVGRMTRAMNVFRQNAIAVQEASAAQRTVVEGLSNGLAKLVDGELTYEIAQPFPGEYEELRTNFNRAMASMAEALTAVSHAAGGINTGASEIRQASDDLSQRTEQQAASLEEAAAAMEQITTNVQQTAQDASKANEVVGQTRAEAEMSGNVVSKAVEAMNAIERGSAEISEIIAVIDGIAFQTNLLALNAGVEAARAGEAGRGFAVVASEVRALAQRSAEAAKDVKARINTSSEQVATGVQLVSETGDALRRIIERIGEMSHLVGAIAAAAEQQSEGLQQVNSTVAEMDGVTQQNAAMVEEATAAARSLASEAEELARQVARFDIGSDRGNSQSTRPAVHVLQDRVAKAARPARRAGSAALAEVADEDWSGF